MREGASNEEKANRKMLRKDAIRIKIGRKIKISTGKNDLKIVKFCEFFRTFHMGQRSERRLAKSSINTNFVQA